MPQASMLVVHAMVGVIFKEPVTRLHVNLRHQLSSALNTIICGDAATMTPLGTAMHFCCSILAMQDCPVTHV